MTELINQQSIHSKLFNIQTEIGVLFRTEENKFQKYKYFTEKQCLELLKPLLEKHKVALYLSDVIAAERSEDSGNILINVNNSTDLHFEKDGNNWMVKYLKKAQLVNIDSIKEKEEKITFYLWAIGSNNDLAKAKGSAETYALKYFLHKFFLIPVLDENDPDKFTKQEKEKVLTPEEQSKVDAFLKKHRIERINKTNKL